MLVNGLKNSAKEIFYVFTGLQELTGFRKDG